MSEPSSLLRWAGRPCVLAKIDGSAFTNSIRQRHPMPCGLQTLSCSCAGNACRSCTFKGEFKYHFLPEAFPDPPTGKDLVHPLCPHGSTGSFSAHRSVPP